MRDQIIEFREERDLGQKFNATFTFLRQNFKPLCQCILFFVVPFALLAGIFSGIYQSTQIDQMRGAYEYGSWGAYAFASSLNSLHYWISMFFSLVSFVLLSLTIYSYMLQYMANQGKVEMTHVWEIIKANFIPVLYSAVGILVICGLATLVLVVPGIYVMVPLCMFAVVMLVEEISLVEAMERCFYLVKGYWWPAFGFLLVTFLIQGVISYVASLPAIAVYVLRILQLPGGSNDLLFIVASSVTTIVGLLLYVISITAIAFLYFDLVEKKEGIGLLEQVNQIGAQPKSFVETE
ncbi:hypothetical protein [Sabulibacter ruber]|uniref:hypothetical protein n=1 Tax=Sabulibacter ruber TaxID=2811901 RepID=UPI001A958A5E|nr:hypothetical protein [Sabulibacter ruber]